MRRGTHTWIREALRVPSSSGLEDPITTTKKNTPDIRILPAKTSRRTVNGGTLLIPRSWTIVNKEKQLRMSNTIKTQ